MNLDDELRRLFRNDQLEVPVPEETRRAILAAARKKRRRGHRPIVMAGVVSAATLVCGGVALGQGMDLPLVSSDPEPTVTAAEPSSQPAELVAAPPTSSAPESTEASPEPEPRCASTEPTAPVEPPVEESANATAAADPSSAVPEPEPEPEPVPCDPVAGAECALPEFELPPEPGAEVVCEEITPSEEPPPPVDPSTEISTLPTSDEVAEPAS